MKFETSSTEKSDFSSYVSTTSINSKSLYSPNVSSTAKSSLNFASSNTSDAYLSKIKDNYESSKINNNIINPDKQYSFMTIKGSDITGKYAKAHGDMPVFNTAPYLYMK